MTVTALARRCGVSRSTLLHYESLGPLRRPPRTAGNYRVYGEQDAARVQQISVYRKVGLGLGAIRGLLGRPDGDVAAILQRRLVDIDAEIDRSAATSAQSCACCSGHTTSGGSR